MKNKIDFTYITFLLGGWIIGILLTLTVDGIIYHKEIIQYKNVADECLNLLDDPHHCISYCVEQFEDWGC